MNYKRLSLQLTYAGLLISLFSIFLLIGWRGGLFVTGILVFIIGTVAYSEYKKEENERR